MQVLAQPQLGAISPLLWESSRQSLIARSTAETELTGLVSAAQSGKAAAVLVSEIVPEALEKRLYGDNSASIAIVGGPPTSWRTRHLRLRAASLREKLEEGEWSIHHLPGDVL